MLASGRVFMPASLILLAYSQSYKTMRNKSGLSKKKRGRLEKCGIAKQCAGTLHAGGEFLKLHLKKQNNQYNEESAI